MQTDFPPEINAKRLLRWLSYEEVAKRLFGEYVILHCASQLPDRGYRDAATKMTKEPLANVERSRQQGQHVCARACIHFSLH